MLHCAGLLRHVAVPVICLARGSPAPFLQPWRILLTPRLVFAHTEAGSAHTQQDEEPQTEVRDRLQLGNQTETAECGRKQLELP